MCGRFYLDVDFDDILKRYGYLISDGIYKSNKEFFPSTPIAVITPEESQLKFSYMDWGFTPSFSKRPIINARTESIFDKTMFKQPILSQRCIVPATGYFEWLKENKNKVKHCVTLENQGLFSMAGIFRHITDNNGKNVSQVSILTREATPDIRWLHNRVPLILNPENEKQYLNPLIPKEEIESIIKTTLNKKLIIKQIEEMQLSLF